MPALFDTGAIELLRRRHRRVELLADRFYPPVACPQVVDEFLRAQFEARVSDRALVAARIFLAPFEILPVSARTREIWAQLRHQLQVRRILLSDPVCRIAAHAFEHALPVVTTDREFRRVPGLEVHVIMVPTDPGAAGGQEKRRPALAGRL